MITKVFSQPMDTRKVEVSINKEENFIDFYFVKDNNKQWFYDIPLDDYLNEVVINNTTWEQHMKEKRWFTKEMSDFIKSK